MPKWMSLILICAGSLALTSPASADTCSDDFARLITGPLHQQPVKGYAVLDASWGSHLEHEVEWEREGHDLYKTVVPANKGWTLTLDGAIFTSNDSGASWTEVSRLPTPEVMTKFKADLIASIANATCTEVILDGAAYNLVEADTASPDPNKASYHTKYWLDPKTGFLARREIKMRATGFESDDVHTWTPAPGLTLPVPSTRAN